MKKFANGIFAGRWIVSWGAVRKIGFILILLVVSAGSSAAPGFDSTFAVVKIDGSEYVEINAVAAVMNWTKSWDNVGNRLVCRGSGNTIEFTVDSPFILLNDKVGSMHEPMRMINGKCFIPIRGILDWTSKFIGESLRWSSERHRFFKIGGLDGESIIEGVSIRRIGNTVQLRVTFLDNTRYEFTEHNGNYILRFPDSGPLPGECALPEPVPPITGIGAECPDGVSTELVVNVRKNIDPPKLVETVNPRGILIVFNYKKPSNVWDILPMTGITPLRERVARRKRFRTVVIDPGHGGIDPGCISNSGMEEKNVTLDIALKTAAFLRRDYGLRVLMTRTDDRYVSLAKRCEFANIRKADLFISIHANASVDPTLKGVQTFYFRDPGSSRELAEKAEMSLGHDANSIRLPIPMNDVQKSYIQASFEAAGCISYMMGKSLDMHNLGIHAESFYVLRGVAMPAVLVEAGFLSCPREEAMLADNNARRRIAKAIADGVRVFMNL